MGCLVYCGLLNGPTWYEGESDGKSVHARDLVWVVMLIMVPDLIRETDLEKVYKCPEIENYYDIIASSWIMPASLW